MAEPIRRITFSDEVLEHNVRIELLCRVPPDLTARLLTLIPHEEVVFRATPRQRRATIWLMSLLLIASAAVAWPLYQLAINISGLDVVFRQAFDVWNSRLELAYRAWPDLQQWAQLLTELHDVLQVTLAAVLLWLGVEYLLPLRHAMVSLRRR